MANEFQDTLEEFKNDIKGRKATVNEMLQILNNRGFGALLIIPCLIELLPTGVIPGVPTFCGVLIILIASQMVIGRHHLWLPKPIRTKKFKSRKIHDGLDHIFPYVHWVDRRSKARLYFLSSRIAERVAALAIITLALTFPALELIPFASSIPAFVILVFGVGFITKDGFILALAWGLFAIGSCGIAYIINSTL